MKFNPDIHKRKSIRFKGYEYSQAGLYFITICVQNRECRFGKIENDEMISNEYGTFAFNQWEKLPERFANFDLDVFQIMPNHMHGIIALHENVGAGFTPALNDDRQPHSHSGQPQGIAPTNATVGDIVGAYKSLVANGCLEIYKSKFVRAGLAPAQMGKLWQRNYYEHIIRNQQSYETISNYIINNPAKWQEDKFYQL